MFSQWCEWGIRLQLGLQLELQCKSVLLFQNVRVTKKSDMRLCVWRNFIHPQSLLYMYVAFVSWVKPRLQGHTTEGKTRLHDALFGHVHILNSEDQLALQFHSEFSQKLQSNVTSFPPVISCNHKITLLGS